MSGTNRAPLEYHLRELDIAEDRQSDRQSLPEVAPTCRRLLDVGCGIGQSLIALKLSPSVEAHGVDIDEEAVAFGASRSPHLQVSGIRSDESAIQMRLQPGHGALRSASARRTRGKSSTVRCSICVGSETRRRAPPVHLRN